MKKMQSGPLARKATMSELEDMVEVINSRLDIVEEKGSELEGIAINTIPNVTCRTMSFSELWDNFKQYNKYKSGVLKREKKEGEKEKEKMAGKFPNLMKKTHMPRKLNDQDAQET